MEDEKQDKLKKKEIDNEREKKLSSKLQLIQTTNQKVI